MMRRQIKWMPALLLMLAIAVAGCRTQRMVNGPGVCVVDAVLVHKPVPQQIEPVCPYGEWTCFCLYRVERVLSGSITNSQIAVLHSAIADWQVAPSYAARKEGHTYRLRLVSMDEELDMTVERMLMYVPNLSPPDDRTDAYWYMFFTERTPPFFYDPLELEAAYKRRMADQFPDRKRWGPRWGIR